MAVIDPITELEPDAEFIPSHTDFKVRDLWWKLSKFAKSAGRELVEKALWLHYAAQRAETPTWAKSVIYGALAYFILPADVIPDVIPASGYSDDLAVIAVAIGTVATFIDENVKHRASAKLQTWFGDKSI